VWAPDANDVGVTNPTPRLKVKSRVEAAADEGDTEALGWHDLDSVCGSWKQQQISFCILHPAFCILQSAVR
jgi:hypothetical protein